MERFHIVIDSRLKEDLEKIKKNYEEQRKSSISYKMIVTELINKEIKEITKGE